MSGAWAGPSTPSCRDDRGASLLLVILTLLVVGALSHGALVLASGEATAVNLGVARGLSRLGAEGVLRHEAVGLPGLPAPDSVAYRRVDTPQGRGFEVRLRGLYPGVALVEVSPGDGPASGRPMARALVRVMDPPAVAREASPALQAPAVLVLAGADEGVDPDCPLAPTSPGAPGAPPLTEPAVGPFPLEDLARRAPAIGPSDTLPTPRLHSAIGAVALSDWSGAGILAVDGELVLGRGTHFQGVVVAGAVRLEDGARVVGLVRAARTVRVEPGAGVLASPCRVEETLAGISELMRSSTVPGGWLGPGP